MHKVVHLTTVHQPNDVRIFQKEAVTLAASGYQVTLIACADESSERSGVTLRALRKPRNRLERMTRTAIRAFRAALNERGDLYHFHDPELIPVGLLLRACGKRVVYDVHEETANDVFDKPYLPRWAKPFVRAAVEAIERTSIHFFNAIVATRTSIATKYPAARTVLIRNVPKVDELLAGADIPFGSRPRAAMYVGGLADFNGVEQMIRAMGELPPESDIRLLLGGRPLSAPDDARFRSLPGSERVEFLGWLDREGLRRAFANARVGLVVYQPTPNILRSEPTKFFEVLSAGLPLIVSDLPHWRQFVEEHDCGLAVAPDDPKAIGRAIATLVNDPERAEAMGKRGRALVVGEYNWEAESEKLLALYRRLLGPPAESPAGATVAAPCGP
jgi:glycosyltransferase involved in cell wall biosynthesis